MIVSRSTFLKACGVFALGRALPEWQWAAAPVAATGALTAAGFRAHLNSTFHLDGTSHVMRLADVHEGPAQDGLEQFSLIFNAAGSAIEDGIHSVRHVALGRQDIFISRIGPPAAAQYEACFSRHRRVMGADA